MKSTVFFSSMRSKSHKSPLNKIKKLFLRAGGNDLYKKDELVALKVHFGELGNTAFLRPIYLRPLLEVLAKQGAKPYLTDTNTLYTGMRTNSVDHLHNAALNGFNYSTLQVPIIIADGLRGENDIDLTIPNAIVCKTAHIATDIANADKLLTVSHFKGHEMTGFGGAMKNLAMGCGSRRGKMDMHSDVRPAVNPKRCTACGRCKIGCAWGAIDISHYAVINDKCTGCAKCIAACPEHAIQADFDVSCDKLQQRIVEYAAAVHNHFSTVPVYISILTAIVPACDCHDGNDAPLVPDIGFMSSTDPVAIDKAAYDMIVNVAGKDVFKEAWPHLDPTDQFKHAQKIKFGNLDYEIKEID